MKQDLPCTHFQKRKKKKTGYINCRQGKLLKKYNDQAQRGTLCSDTMIISPKDNSKHVCTKQQSFKHEAKPKELNKEMYESAIVAGDLTILSY